LSHVLGIAMASVGIMKIGRINKIEHTNPSM
jgi:hypothetical protein